MEKRNISFSPPDITELEIEEVVKAMRSGWITTGPRTKELEKKLAEYCNTNRVVCLNSATAAEELNFRVLGIGEGDEVIVPAYTYKKSDKMICISHDMKEFIKLKGISEKKINVIYNWGYSDETVDIPWSENLFVKKYNLSRDKFYAIYTFLIIFFPILSIYRSPIASIDMGTFLICITGVAIALNKKWVIELQRKLLPLILYVVIITSISIFSVSLYAPSTTVLMRMLRFVILLGIFSFCNKDYFDFDYGVHLLQKVTVIASVCSGCRSRRNYGKYYF